MINTRRQRPKPLSKTAVTARNIGEVLPQVLNNIGRVYLQRPDLILAAWPEIIGSKLSSMTEAVSFESGVLWVNVKNATLYSLLRQNDKSRILKSLRMKFPRTEIKNIIFRVG